MIFLQNIQVRILIKDRRKKNFVEDVNHSEIAGQRVNLSTLSTKIGGKTKKLGRKFLYSHNQGK